jgi:polyhydroxyalkanoate synthase
LVDFADAGDLSVFIDEEQLQLLESRMKEDGYLKASDIAATFNMLRSNDMIWSFYVNNYLMGKDPFAFDILYWNADSTRLPATVHSYYLRNMYQSNLLKVKGGITLNDVAIDLSLIQQPTYILAAKSDHIVPWKSAYQSTKLYGADCRFVLSDSGHVAGVVNHPSRQKYCYWVHGEPNVSYKQLTAENWMVSAAQLPGSWWIDWAEWLKSRSGALIDAISPIVEDAIELAPGSYVKQKAVD